MKKLSKTALMLVAPVMINLPAYAAKEPPVELAKCETSFGSVAVVEGDAQGWSKFGLGSPRELIAALATESGCFSLHNPGSGQNTTFLLNIIAGDKEEVDKGMELAKSAATEGLIRSGAAGTVLSKVPVGGALIGMFGGLGGKKKTVAAGIRVISPASGMTMASGSGEAKKTTLSLNGAQNVWQQGASASGYAGSMDGQMLTEAFIVAFNSVVAQSEALAAAPMAAPAASAAAVVAVDTLMYTQPNKTSTIARALRADTALTPTGNREGIFVEVADNYGTKGWVSVEDLK